MLYPHPTLSGALMMPKLSSQRHGAAPRAGALRGSLLVYRCFCGQRRGSSYGTKGHPYEPQSTAGPAKWASSPNMQSHRNLQKLPCRRPSFWNSPCVCCGMRRPGTHLVVRCRRSCWLQACVVLAGNMRSRTQSTDRYRSHNNLNCCLGSTIHDYRRVFCTYLRVMYVRTCVSCIKRERERERERDRDRDTQPQDAGVGKARHTHEGLSPEHTQGGRKGGHQLCKSTGTGNSSLGTCLTGILPSGHEIPYMKGSVNTIARGFLRQKLSSKKLL